MAETPTTSAVIAERPSIGDKVPDGSTLAAFINRALADVKRFVRNVRGVEWSTIYDATAGEYLKDTDGNANNQDQLEKAITLMAIGLVYKEYSQTVNDSQWWDLYIAYREDAETLLKEAKLDIDRDESGAIDAGEEKAATQTFLSR